MSTLAIHGGSPVRTTPFGGWPVFGPEEEAALLAALRSGVWGSIDGTFVKQLEVEFAALQAARYGVSCVNGTMALSVALKALGLSLLIASLTVLWIGLAFHLIDFGTNF